MWIPQAIEGGLRCQPVSRLRVPEQDQIIDKEDQGGGACGGLGHPVLGIFKAQELLDVAAANLQGPTSGKDLQDLRGGEGEIEGEEAIVAAAATGVTHHDDAQELWAGARIPQGVDGLVPELDPLSVERDGGFDPFRFFVLRPLKGTGQAVAFLPATPPLDDPLGEFIEGGLHVHAADQLGVGGQVTADGLAGILAISEDAQRALGNPTGHDVNHLQGQFGTGAILLGRGLTGLFALQFSVFAGGALGGLALAVHANQDGESPVFVGGEGQGNLQG